MLFPNLPIKTAGGKVFWDTFDRRNGWKLQQNRLTGHFRILDPEDVRQAWGDEEGEMWRSAPTAHLLRFERSQSGFGRLERGKRKSIRERIESEHAEALFVTANITNEEKVANVVKQTFASFSKVDVVFNISRDVGRGLVQFVADPLLFSVTAAGFGRPFDGSFRENAV